MGTPPGTGAFLFGLSASPRDSMPLASTSPAPSTAGSPAPDLGRQERSAVRSRSPRSPRSVCSATRTRSGARSCSTTSGRSGTTRSSASSGLPPGALPRAARAVRRLPHLRAELPAGGLAPIGYHLVNVLVHVANALLVYALVQLTFRTPRLQDSALAPSSRAIALVAAALFVAHPLHTQAVAYVVQRLTSLTATFYLATVVLYAAWRLRDAGAERDGNASAAAPPSRDRAPRHEDEGDRVHAAVRGRPVRVLLPRGPGAARLSGSRRSSRRSRSSRSRRWPRGPRARPTSSPRLAASTRIDTPLPRLEYLTTQLVVVVKYLGLLVFPAGQNVDHDVPIYRSAARAARRGLPRAARGARRGRRLPLPPDLAQAGAGALDPAARLVAFGIAWFFLALPSSRRSSRSRTSCTSTGSTCRRSGSSSRRRRRSPRSPGGCRGWTPRGPPCSRARSSPSPVDRDARAERGLGGRPVALVRRGPQVAAQAEAVREPRDRARPLRPTGARRARPPAGGHPRSRLDLRPRTARGGAPVARPQGEAELELRDVLRLAPARPRGALQPRDAPLDDRPEGRGAGSLRPVRGGRPARLRRGAAARGRAAQGGADPRAGPG